MELFDTHTHLESPRFDADRTLVIARARSAGVVRMLSCGSDIATSQENVRLAAQHEGLYAAVGIHGHEARSAVVDAAACEDTPQITDAILGQLAELASAPRVVAIGEIGLDYHYNFSPPPVQRAALARQLKLASVLGLPVILHNRESDADLRRIVDEAGAPLRGVLHCFLADQAMAEWALSKGLYIGIAGPITFKNMTGLAEIVRRIPLDRLLVETDCPYLAPHPHRGSRNEPAFVVQVAAKLAEILDLPLHDIVRYTTDNACRLFGVS
jgi:TatD DNase family protein